MKLRTLLATAAICVPFTAAQAAPASNNGNMSYTYGEVTYQIETDPDAHHWGLKGSYQFNDQLYLTAEDKYLTEDGRSGGIGAFAPIDDNLHVYGQISLADSAYKRGVRPFVEAGARLALNNEMEVRGAARYMRHTAKRGEKDEFYFQAEGLYKTAHNFDVLAGVAVPVENDGVVISAGTRYNF